MSRRAAILWLLPVLVLLGAAAAWRDYQAQLSRPVALQAPRPFMIAPGAGLNSVISELQSLGLLAPGRQATYLRLHARLTGLDGRLQAGEYLLSAGLTPRAMLALFASGKTLLHPLRVGEGMSFAQLVALVNSSEMLRHELAGRTHEEIMRAIGRPGLHPEGRFLPDTYHFARNTGDAAFLRRAAAAMDQVLEQEWAGRQPELPYASPEEALVMASIVEKETGVAEERAMVAGVFVNRLRLGMRLQTDPTVIYGIGPGFDGNIRRQDLLTDTPYNTYLRAGLPPTPICMPGRAALRAALHPASTQALFFVSRGDGTHVFSETLEQHNEAVRRYQIRQPQPAAATPTPAKPKSKSKAKTKTGKKRKARKS